MESTPDPTAAAAATTPAAADARPAALTSHLERMRLQAAQNPDAMHRAFDSYPWPKDPKFQSLLAAALLSQDGLTPAEAALQCRIQLYGERIGIKIDAEAYKTYRSQPERSKVDLVPQILLEQEALYEPDVGSRRYAAVAADPTLAGPALAAEGSAPDSDVPSWQRAAPKAALYVNKGGASGAGSEKEPYPKKFEEIIAFLQTGKEIPGIVKIPDTVIDDPSISTTSGRTAPLKPWEKKAASNEANPAP